MISGLSSYIRICAFLDEDIYLGEQLGIIKCPKIKSLRDGLILFNTQLSEFVNIYTETKDNFYFQLLENVNNKDCSYNLFTFAEFSKQFYPETDMSINDTLSIVYSNDDIQRGIISKDNVSFFMETIKVTHHLDKEDYLDKVEVKNERVRKLIEQMKENRKKAQEKIHKKDGIGLLDIMSSVCARHPSLNPTNIKELNYYQLIDQFNRLNRIDDWQINTSALASGNLPEEGRKKIKHYTDKADD
jgi:hypothetical protein